VWRETGGTSVNDTAYGGSSLTHSLAGLTSGAIYRISIRSRNGEGYSAFSQYLELAASSLPAAPVAASLRKNVSLSAKTSIYLEWDKVPNQQVDTSGYLLWMASNAEGSEDFVLIMNGTEQPERNEFSALGLQSGERYRFKLQALNFNGASVNSSVYTYNACLPPSSLPAPYRLDSTTSSITVGWNEPLDDGGCPITGFALYRDQADEGVPLTEVNSANEAGLASVPTVR